MKHSIVLGSGYVGSELARRLLSAGQRVTTVNRSGRTVPGATAVIADLADLDRLERSLSPVDCIFLTVAADATDEASYRAAYVDGARSLCGLARRLGAQRILFTSSTAVYAQDDGSWVDESSGTEPDGFRGETMLEAERIVLASSVASSVLRLSGIYGPGRGRLIEIARAGAPVERLRFTNRIHRDDAAGALAHLASIDAPRSLYVVSDSAAVPLHEVLAWIAGELKVAAPTAPAADQVACGKRCRNDRLLASGYSLRYPSYREGYLELLDG